MFLIIVESPTKARTLSRFLGCKYHIMASMGHIRDLPKGKLGVDIEHQYRPTYQTMPGKSKIIKELKEAFSQAEKIIMATDPDREGEAIAYHICQILKIKDKKSKTVRISFHEITKEAVEAALKNPGQIRMSLVDAQQARRVLDRLVGYQLSPLLWRKVRRGLSAGRVQSVAVRLIAEREKEILAFKPETYFDFFAKLYKDSPDIFLTAKLIRIADRTAEIKDHKTAVKIEQDLKKAKYVVDKINNDEVVQSPPPPLITSTLQRSAANMFRFSAKKTMMLAQRLYEAGLITYHRTDSVQLSSQALAMFREYIHKEYGQSYLPENPRFYRTKAKSAQEAHEAIRPTDPHSKAELTPDENKIYTLIKSRAVGCQMKAAVWQKTTVNILADRKYGLRKVAQKLLFDGYLKAWTKKTEPADPEIEAVGLLQAKDSLLLKEVSQEEKQTQPPSRYSEATLIKALEDWGIGRPSTYAPIITTIQARQYVEKKEGRFWPTPVGMTVNNYLFKHFPVILDYDFTAKMENDLDKIADGTVVWHQAIDEFYRPFTKALETAAKKSARVEIPTEKTGEKCPKCATGDQVIRVGRFGKFLSCSNFPKCDWKGKYREIVQGIKCPQCGEAIVVRQTRRGARFYGCNSYPKCRFASWKKPQG